ncbi:LPS biosynthesis protein, partial [Sodalis-like endosymbiont of Proechinophthirus fluctus]|uniref:LPS assembly protein LptD n=1 Tax=Sodalis-like endosymbiont of Proechinophthirus fluctus TaxID=1462730 RepID=UPI0007A7FA9D
MKKRLPTLLVSLIGSALYSQQAPADLVDQCLLGVPAYTKPFVNGNPNTLPVYIQADKAVANYPDHALFSGSVSIEQSNSTLTADEVHLTRRQEQNQTPLRTVTATGNVSYISNEIKMQGPKAWSNLNTKDTDVYHGNYQMVGRQGRGDADTMKQRGDNRYTVLENGSFTSCLPGDESWSVVGSEVIYDREEQVTEIWNARFKIGKVPVFYSPYLQMPVGDKRRSGFLIPNAKYGSNNGFEFSTPYYLNLAPNYDTTITPNYMSKHGTQIQTEFRYLTTPGEGLVEFDWLPKDRVYSSEHASDSDRWLLYWHHNGVMDQVWRFNVDYTKVNGSNYFDDLDSKYGSTTDGYATQKFSFGYADENWDSALSYKQFQIFDTNSSDAYRTAPQFDLTYYKNKIGPFDLKVFSQAAKFTNVNNDYPEATRLHIEPTFNLPLANRWGNLNTEAKLMATHYQQENIDYYNENTTTGRHLKGLVNRVLPQFKTDGKTVFESDMGYAPDYTQTLESRLQYLYVPYRNQNNIGVYDSTILQTDYSGLFRDRTHSGLDRISSANRLTGGVTTRIYDDQRVERFKASIGQIYYFSRPRTGDITSTWDNYDNTGSIVWAGDSYWHISNQWGVRGGLQYDSRLNSVSLGDAVLEYRRDENHILQLNYRYASSQYIEQMLSDIVHPGYQQGISQVGVTGSWPLIDRWSLVGTYYYDTKANQPANQLVSLQYNTCCWAINVGYERKITG